MSAEAPPKPEPRKVYAVRLSAPGIDALKAYAATAGVTPSEVVRAALAAYMSTPPESDGRKATTKAGTHAARVPA